MPFVTPASHSELQGPALLRTRGPSYAVTVGRCCWWPSRLFKLWQSLYSGDSSSQSITMTVTSTTFWSCMTLVHASWTHVTATVCQWEYSAQPEGYEHIMFIPCIRFCHFGNLRIFLGYLFISLDLERYLKIWKEIKCQISFLVQEYRNLFIIVAFFV